MLKIFLRGDQVSSLLSGAQLCPSLSMVALARLGASARALDLPPLLGVYQAADVTEQAPVRAVPPLGGVGPPTLPADQLAVEDAGPGHGAGLRGHGGGGGGGGLGHRRRVVVVVLVLAVEVLLQLHALDAAGGVVLALSLALALLGLAVGALPGGGAGPVAVVAHGGYAAHAAGYVVRELRHEEDVAVGHDGDGALAKGGLVVVHYGAGEV